MIKAIDLKSVKMVVDGQILDMPKCKNSKIGKIEYFTMLRSDLAKEGLSLDGIYYGNGAAWVGHCTDEQSKRFDSATSSIRG